MRFYPADLHTHTTYSDGRTSARSMLERACNDGLTSFGISDHTPFLFEAYWTMQLAEMPAYEQELRALQREFAGRIDFFLGLEQDYFSPVPKISSDYRIGSVHCLEKDGVIFYVDDTEARLAAAIDCHFSGDPYAFAAEYFRLESQVMQKTKADIVGHFDLLTKANAGDIFFDTTSDRYQQMALAALYAANCAGKPFEINTGAIHRGWRSQPYPAEFLLKALFSMQGHIVFSSDSHSADTLCFQFKEAAAFARSAGFREAYLLTRSGWQAVSL